MIQLNIRPYTTEDQPFIDKFENLIEDRRFTRTPGHNIALAKDDVERHPTLVFEDGECVGYFTLHEGKGVEPYSENEQAIFFRSFSIDVKYRGRGVGKQVIEMLPQYIKKSFPHINEIVLTVNTDNEKAIQLYKQAHYTYIGDTVLEGRPVHIMSYQI